MSIQPHAATALNPFEGHDYIPEELQTTDPSIFVSVINCAPTLDISKPHDLFGLEILLGVLAGVRPYGLQTDKRRSARSAFSELVRAGQNNPALLRDLGRVGFIDLATQEPEDDTTLADRIAAEQPRGKIVIITQVELGWHGLKQAVTERSGVIPYRATFKRRTPITEKGMSWTVTGDQKEA